MDDAAQVLFHQAEPLDADVRHHADEDEGDDQRPGVVGFLEADEAEFRDDGRSGPISAV